MPTCTFNIPWTVPNTTGTVDYLVYYRLTGTTPWETITTSGGASNTNITIHSLLANNLYDIQVENINNSTNPISNIVQAIGFTDPGPTVSTTNTSIAYSFPNLSSYISTYTVSIALAISPGIPLQTQVLSAQTLNSGSFSGLTAFTAYLMSIQVAASQFTHTFYYDVTTQASATCASPSSVYAALTSSGGAMTVYWTAPIPYPSCNYNLYYRPKNYYLYSALTTSGFTSGGSSYSIPLTSPACYEGYIQSNCCSNSFSPNVPFGVNYYQQLFTNITTLGAQKEFLVNITTANPNPYNTVVSGNFYAITTSGSSLIPYSVTYPAGSTSASIPVPGYVYNSGTTSGNTITSLLPQFDNGGALQQNDSLLTPQYFAYIPTSGFTWSGSPLDLPSFTLDTFNVTATNASSGIVTAGQLNFSWIYDFVYSGGAIPYNVVNLSIYDQSANLMGTVITNTGTLGLQNATINILDKSGYGITDTTLYTFKATWASGSLISSKNFYLPVFVP